MLVIMLWVVLEGRGKDDEHQDADGAAADDDDNDDDYGDNDGDCDDDKSVDDVVFPLLVFVDDEKMLLFLLLLLLMMMMMAMLSMLSMVVVTGSGGPHWAEQSFRGRCRAVCSCLGCSKGVKVHDIHVQVHGAVKSILKGQVAPAARAARSKPERKFEHRPLEQHATPALCTVLDRYCD